jgi:hypothetical protein
MHFKLQSRLIPILLKNYSFLRLLRKFIQVYPRVYEVVLSATNFKQL